MIQLPIIRVLPGEPCNVERVNRFYTCFNFASRAHCGDNLIIAREGEEITGVVRLCLEDGHYVLRGMLVAEMRRGQGLGRQLLMTLVQLLDGAPCFALPFGHLQFFYEQAGFRLWPVDQAPAHLRQRFAEYRQGGLEIILMKRPGTLDDRIMVAG